MSDESLLHVIRLRGPWEFEVVGRTGDVAGGRINAPVNAAAIMGSQFGGTIRFLRRFGWPEELDSAEHVYLVLDTVGRLTQATLNGTDLIVGNRDCSPEMDVTSLLKVRNRLTLDLELLPGSSDLLLSGIQLEIRRLR